MVVFKLVHPQARFENVGFLVHFLDSNDMRRAREQINANYAHGGGWCRFEGFEMLRNGNLKYPGDRPVQLLAEGWLREELIRVYDGSWVAIIQPTGEFEVARID